MRHSTDELGRNTSKIFGIQLLLFAFLVFDNNVLELDSRLASLFRIRPRDRLLWDCAALDALGFSSAHVVGCRCGSLEVELVSAERRSSLTGLSALYVIGILLKSRP